ncbi:MAG TPA: ParA family protein [Thermodesulfobacteriota bacterium]|nr:ParA family protein [Thermodesulfobacteriota bacterium]
MFKITVANQKGGVGKTTSALNLSAAMAKIGKRVLIIDTDAQGSIATLLNIRPKDTLYNFLIEGVKFEECVVNVRLNVDCIFSDKKTEIAEMHLVPIMGREKALAERMEGIDNYDICFVDCAPSLSLLQTNAVIYTKYLILPISMDSLAIAGASHVQETFVLLKKYFQIIPIILGILPTFVDARLSLTDQVLSTIQEIWGNSNTIIFPPIRVDANLAKANRYHQTIFEYAPQSRAAEDYMKVAEILLDFIAKRNEIKSGEELIAQEEKTG